jgi:hypothetical protein
MSNSETISWKVEAKPRLMQPDTRAVYAGIACSDDMCCVVGLSTKYRPNSGGHYCNAGPDLTALRFFVTDRALSMSPYKYDLMKYCTKVEENCDMNRAVSDFRRHHNVKRVVYDPVGVSISAQGIACVPAQDAFFPKAWEYITQHQNPYAKSRDFYEHIHSRHREESPICVLAYFLASHHHDAPFESIKENLSEPVAALLCAVAAWGESPDGPKT